MAKDRTNIYVVSIIALVAVIGLVTLFMNNAETPAPVVVDEGGNVVGEASQLPAKYNEQIKEPARKTKFQIPQLDLPPAVCSELEECGIPEQVLVTHAEIQRYYGRDDFVFTKTAAQICRDMGYKGCFAGQLQKEMKYFESSDGSCRNTQTIDIMYSHVSCSKRGFSGYGYCTTWPPRSTTEPIAGDVKTVERLTDAICIK